MRIHEYRNVFAKRKRKSPEHDSQVALIRLINMSLDKYPDLDLVFAIPNGGHRDIRTAKRLSAEGVKAGVPDLMFPVARGAYHGLFIEMKANKNRPTVKQKIWHKKLASQGYLVKICYSADEAFQLLVGYLDS